MISTFPKGRYQFASDNTAGICPEAWRALESANHGNHAGYGDDGYTAAATDLLREVFGCPCDVYFVFNGTAANSLTTAALCKSYHSVICAESAHLETDECGAPEFFSNGTKVLTVPAREGKLDPASIEGMVSRRSDIHYPKPKLVSISQATEFGTVYTREEISRVACAAKALGLRVHMDGARFANAVVSLGIPASKMVEGIDVLCFGGTKNGMAFGEAVVFFDPELGAEFGYRCKQAGQLASKMRFLSAPFAALVENGAWLTRAANANARAKELEAALRDLPGLEIAYPVEANSVFIRMPDETAARLHAEGWKFYHFIAGAHRFMCSWATSSAEVEELVGAIRAALRN